MIQVAEFHANSLNEFIRAYLSKYFNALHSIEHSSIIKDLKVYGHKAPFLTVQCILECQGMLLEALKTLGTN